MQIKLLGSLQVLIDQVPVDVLRGQRVRSIFIYLVLHAETAVSRSELAGNLWPDIAENQARTNLRRELHALKNTHTVINACITASKHTVTWHMPADYTFDVEQFDKLCRAFNLESDNAKKSNLGLEAVALYHDPLLPGIADEWLSIKREALHHQWNLLSENLIGLLQNFDVSEQIINIATRQLSFDPYLETAYLAMMEAYITSGNSAMALHTYHQCASVLKKDLAIAPNERIQNLYTRLISKNRLRNQTGGETFALKENSTLVGRSETLLELTELIKMSFGGSPQIVFITGESGIGKSRLADEILNSDSLKALMKIRSECHPARVESAFGPFKDWMTNPHFGNACRHAREFENETIQQIFPQLASYATVPTNKKNRQLRSQEEIFAALSNIVYAVSEFYSSGQQTKLLLYIDDMQWADSDFFNWLKYFLINQNDSNVIFLATIRAEEMNTINNISGLIKDFGFSNQVSAIQLPYLNREDACELINKQLANYTQSNLAQIDPDNIYDLVQGNPLFLIESINHLLHAEGLPQAIGKQNGSGAAPKIYSMLKRRIDLLEENSRQLLLHASVIQRQFSLSLIQAITQFTDSQLMDALDNLWGRRMLREVGRGDYDFVHDSLREACYAALTSPRQRIMHGQVAKVLEQLKPEQTESFAGEIATHYEKSGDAETALDWFQRAIKHSNMTMAAGRAIEYSERGLQLFDTTLSIVKRAESQIKLLLGLAVGHSLKEGFGSKALFPICRKMEELLPYVDNPETRWKVIYVIRLAATFSYQTYSALRLTELQLSTANDTGSVTNTIDAYKSRAFVLYQLGRFTEALSYLDAGLKVALTAESQGELDRYRPSWPLAMLSKIRVQVLYLIGRFSDALAENQISHNHEYCVGDPRSRSFVYMWEAENHFIRNRPADAEKIGKTMVKAGLEEQVPQIEYLGRFFCDWAEWKKGNTEAAIAKLDHTITTYESLETNISLSLWYHALAEMQYSAKHFDEALDSNAKAIQAVRRTRVFNRKADIYRVRGNILAAIGSDPAAVIRLYDLSLKTALKQSALMYTLQTLIDKLTFLRKHKLPSQTDVQQLRQVVNRVQMSSDFAPLAVAQKLLDAFPE